MTRDSELRERFTSWPPSLAALRDLVERYASRGVVKRADGAIQIAPTPWVGSEAFAVVIFPPAEPTWIADAAERMGVPIPAPYAEILRATNGCFAFDLSLYGLPSAGQGATPRLDRATLQPFDLERANRSWAREYRARPNGLYIGGRSWSREANCGYFLADDGSIRSVLRSGESVGTWPSAELMLATELPIAERGMLNQAPAGTWSTPPARPVV
ncbi:MAG TPA: hypothetical protein VJ650_16965 [Gemmatimonadaceae bacterium]|nr:hypothetical protein [Gemmatimonadaceae bacterium]